MKNLIAILMTFISQISLATPIVNENVANSGVMTIYPDSHDPNRFYIAPNVVMIGKDQTHKPYFSYNEFKKNIFGIIGIMQMTLIPAYTREELETAKAELLKRNPQAQFSGVPFISSSLELTGELPELISENKCNHAGGLVGQEQACTMVLTKKGRTLFLRSLEKKTIFTTLQFSYSVQAVVRKGDGSFADQKIEHGIAVRLDGDQLSQFPDLIHRL